jgi:hypothetical protein
MGLGFSDLIFEFCGAVAVGVIWLRGLCWVRWVFFWVSSVGLLKSMLGVGVFGMIFVVLKFADVGMLGECWVEALLIIGDLMI